MMCVWVCVRMCLCVHVCVYLQVCEGSWRDVCGVCAGNSSSCELVSGTFSRSVLPVGYHKVLEIPSGARLIKIQETVKSKNYLGETKMY